MARQAASDRQAWAVQRLDVRGEQRLLEVGCGHGVALSLVAAQLTSGHVVGLDRSAAMVRAARERNADHLAAGRVRVEQATYPDGLGREARFDTVFALHVADFWRRPERLLPATAERLAPGGALWLFTQPPAGHQAAGAAWAATTAAVLRDHGWTAATVVDALATAWGAAVRAEPPAQRTRRRAA